MTTPKTIFTDDIKKAKKEIEEIRIELEEYKMGSEGHKECLINLDEDEIKLQTLELCEKKHLKFVDDVEFALNLWWNGLQNGDVNEYDVGYAEVTYDDFEELKQKLKQLEEHNGIN